MLTPPQADTDTNKWFSERRDLFVKNMTKGFYETFNRFTTLYQDYMAQGEVPFDSIDHLVGTETGKGRLWDLKDRCHALWRDADPKFEMNGCLLDWVLGSIFHEAMKLKENVYMLHYYGPMAESMREKDTASTVKFCGEECQRFMERTRYEISRQMENLGFMFGRANFLLRTMMNEQHTNCLLVRFLVENPDIPETLWGESLETLFSDMFIEGPEFGYCAAARSYREGDWFERAHGAYAKALALNPDCAEAQSRIHQLKPLIAIHKENLS